MIGSERVSLVLVLFALTVGVSACGEAAASDEDDATVLEARVAALEGEVDRLKATVMALHANSEHLALLNGCSGSFTNSLIDDDPIRFSDPVFDGRRLTEIATRDVLISEGAHSKTVFSYDATGNLTGTTSFNFDVGQGPILFVDAMKRCP